MFISGTNTLFKNNNFRNYNSGNSRSVFYFDIFIIKSSETKDWIKKSYYYKKKR